MDGGPPGAHTQAAGYCSEQLTLEQLVSSANNPLCLEEEAAPTQEGAELCWAWRK